MTDAPAPFELATVSDSFCLEALEPSSLAGWTVTESADAVSRAVPCADVLGASDSIGRLTLLDAASVGPEAASGAICLSALLFADVGFATSG